MVVINLLPWREHLRNYQRNSMFKLLLLTLLLNILCFFGLHLILSYKIKRLETDDHVLQVEIKNSEEKRQMESSDRTHTISTAIADALRYSRMTTKIVTHVGQINRRGICFREISRHKHQIKLTGDAYSIIDFSEFLKTWQAAKLFSEIIIDHMEQQINGSIRFKFTAKEKV